jgi:predicted ATPase with chaperone activity
MLRRHSPAFSISQFSAECRADAGKIYSAAVYGVDAYFSKQHCKLTQDSQELIQVAMNELNLSARAYDHILKVSRAIADLDSRPTSHPSTSAKRFNNRTLDRTLWV